MHKLKGSAGILGAKTIHQLAGAAEAACKAGEAKLASHLAIRLATQLRELSHNVKPLFEPAQILAEEATS